MNMFTVTAEGGDAQRTMARVWHVTLDRVADTPAAGRVLRQLAWYAPDEIPQSLLAGQVEEPELSEAFGRLAAYSMITLTGDTVADSERVLGPDHFTTRTIRSNFDEARLT